MDGIPDLTKTGIPAAWVVVIVLIWASCQWVFPKLLDLLRYRDGKSKDDRTYENDLRFKGFNEVIEQQKVENDRKETALEKLNAEYIETLKRMERAETKNQLQAEEILRLRDQDQKKSIEIAELRKDLQRTNDHLKNNIAHVEQLDKDSQEQNRKIDTALAKPLEQSQ